MATGMADQSLESKDGATIDSAYDLLTQSMYTAPDWSNEIAGHGILQLFGSWVKTIYDGGLEAGEAISSTLLHDVLITSNYIAMIMFIFLVMYVGWAAILKTAADGEVLGKNWSPVWLPFRTGLAMALMFPMAIANENGSDSGVRVSAIQKFTIYLAFVGSELGDIASNIIYDSIDKKPITNSGNVHKMAVKWFDDLYANHICHNIATTYADQTGFYLKQIDYIEGIPAEIRAIFQTKYTKSSEAFDAIAKLQQQYLAKNEDVPSVRLLFGGENGACGSVIVPGINNVYDGEGVDSVEYVGEKMAIALKQYKTELSKTAYAYSYSTLKVFDELATREAEKVTDTKIEDFIKAYETNSFEGVLRDLKNSFISTVGTELDETSDTTVYGTLKIFKVAMDAVKPIALNDIMKLYKKQGWAGLGQLYYMIGAIGEVKPDTIKFYTNPEFTQQATPETKDMKSLAGDGGWWTFGLFSSFSDTMKQNWDRDMANKYTKYLAYVRSGSLALGLSPNGIASCVENSCTVNNRNISQGIKDQMSGSWLLNFFISDDSYDPTADATVFPLARVQEAGSTLVTVGGTMILIRTVLEAVADGSRVAIESGSGPSWIRGALWTFIKTLIQIPLSAFLMSSTILLGFGVYLAYILPMMPTLMWLMMVVSYFVMVIEAFAASPLAVVQMATPEGEGISGTRMERAISILAALTLTPTLNVIGFIASITVMYIAYPLYNSMFFTAWGFIENASDSGSAAINWLPKVIAGIALYASGLTIMIRQCYTVMATIKQHILEWFSSGASRAFGENESNQKLDSMNEKMGARAGSIDSAIRQMKSTNAQSKKRDEKDDDDNKTRR